MNRAWADLLTKTTGTDRDNCELQVHEVAYNGSLTVSVRSEPTFVGIQESAG